MFCYETRDTEPETQVRHVHCIYCSLPVCLGFAPAGCHQYLSKNCNYGDGGIWTQLEQQVGIGQVIPRVLLPSLAGQSVVKTSKEKARRLQTGSGIRPVSKFCCKVNVPSGCQSHNAVRWFAQWLTLNLNQPNKAHLEEIIDQFLLAKNHLFRCYQVAVWSALLKDPAPMG
jgi:hypothetical protein